MSEPAKQSKISEHIEIVCADCGLPVAGAKPRSDVTRYLSDISRCSCNKVASTSLSAPQTGSMSIEHAALVVGDRFEVLAFLGQGGMGSVFKVNDRHLNKILAVKILNPQLVQDSQSVKRFEQEAKAAIALTHAHLAAVYEYGIGKDNTPFLIMDYLEGTTLDELLKKEGSLDYKRAIDLIAQICEAIAYAHSKGVIHRDIKPSNIIITQPGNGIEFAKLFDFGIAKVLPDQAIDFTQDMTQTGEIFGSPLYMSPEQCKGLSVDQRSDLHAIGCVLFKAVTGSHPFEGKNFIDTVVQIITVPAPSFSKLKLDFKIPSTLEQVIMRCLAKEPAMRYRSASALQTDLERVRDGKAISVTKRERDLENKRAITILATLAGVFLMAISLPPLLKAIAPAPTAPNTVPTDPYSDAERLDSLSFSYFMKGDYERAIPLLEFGINTYKKNGRTKVGSGREDNYLAENLAHIGTCYLKLHKYDKAIPYYRDALKLFQQWGNYPGGLMTPTVNEYAEVLRALNRKAEAEQMLDEYKRTNNISKIP